MNACKVAIIGLGTVSEIHRLAMMGLEEEGLIQLVAACDIDPLKGTGLAPEVRFFTDSQELLDEVRPDAVHLCLPHDLHGPIGRQVLNAGAHLFTEKPLAHTLADAETLIECADRHPDLIAAVCFQNRLNACSQELKRRVESGEDGPLLRVRGTVFWERSEPYYKESPWRGELHHAGGGSLINQAIHTLDLMQYFVGAPPESVRARVMQLRDPLEDVDVEDTAVASFDFPNGVRGFYCSTNVAGSNEPVEVMVELERANYLIRGTQLFRQAKDEEGAAMELIREDERFPGAKFYYGASHRAMIRAFYDAVRGNENAPIVPLREGVQSLRMIDAIFRSSLSGKRIKLD